MFSSRYIKLLLRFYIFVLLLAFASPALNAQEDPYWSFSGDFSVHVPNYIGLSLANGVLRPNLNTNTTLRLIRERDKKLSPTFALGYFGVGHRGKVFKLQPPREDAESRKFSDNNTSLQLAVGLKIPFEQFYILPEVGVIRPLISRQKAKTFYPGDRVEREMRRFIIVDDYAPSFNATLSLGTDFTVSNLKFSGGLRAMYGYRQNTWLEVRYWHYSGGLFVAINFLQ